MEIRKKKVINELKDLDGLAYFFLLTAAIIISHSISFFRSLSRLLNLYLSLSLFNILVFLSSI